MSRKWPFISGRQLFSLFTEDDPKKVCRNEECHLSRNAKSRYDRLSTVTSLCAFECTHMAVIEDFTIRMLYHCVRLSRSLCQ